MPFEAPTLAQQTAFAQSYGRPGMAVHTPYQKSLSDDRKYYGWNDFGRTETNCLGQVQSEIDPLTKISILSSLRLFFHYIKALEVINFKVLELALPIFGKTVKFLLSEGVDIEKISIIHTADDGVLVKGVSNHKSFHFETYFDETEYSSGYEVISNVYADREIVASSAGTIDFVIENSMSK